GRAVGEFGRLDILVNNAGGAMPRAALDTSEGFMARTFAFNVTAPLTLTKLGARRMVDTVGAGAERTLSLVIALTADPLRQQFLDGTPMGRPGEPEDIACAVLYLASDASSWVTGKVFAIDGGTAAPALTVP